MNRGAFDFLTKPIDFADLEATVAKTLRHVAALRQARASAAELQRQRETLMQAEKLAAFGSLLAGVAHELNNPLAIVLADALLLQEDADPALPAVAARAERIRAAAERCARIVRSFLAMARQQALQRRPVPVGPLVDGVLELLAYGLRSDGIAVAREIPEGLPPVLGDADQLHQVLANLVTNARQALEHRSGQRRLRIGARVVGATVEIAVVDNGPGVPDAIRGRVFDPFFTTKPVGSGTGIGLSVSRGIAEAHGGSLDLAEAAGGGTCFLLRLPFLSGAEPAAGVPERRPAAASAAAERTRRALIVDDEVEVARILGELLGALGFRCDLAGTGRQAQRLLSGPDYDIVLCDVRMPDMDGQALYRWLEENRPHLCRRTAFVTGDTLNRATGGFLACSGRPVIEKPFAPEQVRRLVAALGAGGPGDG
jgi:two-component system NtrC family sensor kinase